MADFQPDHTSGSKRDRPGDRDFFQTREGMFFCVTGHLHPPDRYTAYLKYSPDPTGKWQTPTGGYRRELAYYHVKNVAKTIAELSARYPEYVATCPVRGIRFSMIPRDRVAHYYDPRQRLARILSDPRDPLESQVCALIREMTAASGVHPGAFGITGSILIGLHNLEWSDMDLLVYGHDNTRLLRQALVAGATEQITRPDAQQRRQWAERIAARFHISGEEALYFAGRRWNYGYFQGRYFSLHPVRSETEISEQYGEHIYRSAGRATIRAVVASTEAAAFLPAAYRVRQVQVVHGPTAAARICQVIANEGLFCDIVDAGQRIEAAGQIETVDGRIDRLVVGSAAHSGPEYIRRATAGSGA